MIGEERDELEEPHPAEEDEEGVDPVAVVSVGGGGVEVNVRVRGSVVADRDEAARRPTKEKVLEMVAKRVEKEAL